MLTPAWFFPNLLTELIRAVITRASSTLTRCPIPNQLPTMTTKFKCYRCDFPISRPPEKMNDVCPKCQEPKPYRPSSTVDDAAKNPAKKKAAGGNIFDRLTDSSKYTGAHKHRFNADGSGAGKAGRTMDGGVKDISQITRTNLR